MESLGPVTRMLAVYAAGGASGAEKEAEGAVSDEARTTKLAVSGRTTRQPMAAKRRGENLNISKNPLPDVLLNCDAYSARSHQKEREFGGH